MYKANQLVSIMSQLPRLQRKASSKHPTGTRDLIIFGGIVGIALIANQFMPGSRARRAHDAVVREQHQEADASSAIADRRYREACTMPVSPVPINGYYVQAIALSPNGPIPLDPQTGLPLEERTVCDDRGFTARIEHGRFVDIAQSGNQELINQRFADSLGWHENARRSLQ